MGRNYGREERRLKERIDRDNSAWASSRSEGQAAEHAEASSAPDSPADRGEGRR